MQTSPEPGPIRKAKAPRRCSVSSIRRSYVLIKLRTFHCSLRRGGTGPRRPVCTLGLTRTRRGNRSWWCSAAG